MTCEIYRVCETRNEAEGLLMAIANGFFANTTILQDNDYNKTGLVSHPHPIPGGEELDGELDVRLRESKADGKFQLFIRCSNEGIMARVRAALDRRTPGRIEWPKK